MCALLYSTKEKSFFENCQWKTLNCWKKICFGILIVHESKDGLDTFSWSLDLQLFKITCKRDRQLLSVRPLCSDERHQTLDESLIRTLSYFCLLEKTKSLSQKYCKKLKVNYALEKVSDHIHCDLFGQTNMHLSLLWSDHPKRKWPLIRPKSDHCPDLCNRANSKTVQFWSGITPRAFELNLISGHFRLALRPDSIHFIHIYNFCKLKTELTFIRIDV